ncbi:hypothetical protein M413DRAFT_119456 [Hebeloma cylindrosporum]|uniref:Uncharacterized protein n=1 Tax=Hebeloma cylindrosporum TaxID=76867 RepID=A0A0C3D0K4_HEBCY|nr:hypothetical protein M413DRAFT_119456 [Hebeloma cylindrosporum h7]
MYIPSLLRIFSFCALEFSLVFSLSLPVVCVSSCVCTPSSEIRSEASHSIPCLPHTLLEKYVYLSICILLTYSVHSAIFRANVGGLVVCYIRRLLLVYLFFDDFYRVLLFVGNVHE